MSMSLHYDGFEQFSNVQSPMSALNRAGYITDGTIATVYGRGGGSGLGFVTSHLTRIHPWSGNIFSFGCAVRYESRGAIMWVESGDERIMLWIDEDTGNPHLNGVRCGSIPVPGRYYYYEVELNRATGVVSLFVNGRPDGQAQIPGGILSAFELTAGIGLPANSTNGYPPIPIVKSSRLIDDLYVNSGPRLGPITVTTRFANSDGSPVDWSPSEGVFHWNLVSQLPPGLNNAYIVSDEIGDKDLFYSQQRLRNDKRIISTGVIVLARRSPDFVGRLRGIVGDNISADERSAVVSVEDYWRTQYITFPENSSDTKAGIEAASFGVQVAE